MQISIFFFFFKAYVPHESVTRYLRDGPVACTLFLIQPHHSVNYTFGKTADTLKIKPMSVFKIVQDQEWQKT